MNRCERCQPLILDHLYGLLDGPEAATVEAHLRECPACAAARDESARVQGMFAKAARGAFPQVRFEAPVSKPAAPAAASPPVPLATPSTKLPAKPPGRGVPISTWLPWAVAAAVLLAIPGTVLPVLDVLKKANTANRDVRDSVAKLAPMMGEADRARQEIDEPRNAARREYAARTQALDKVMTHWMNEERFSQTQASRTPVDVLKPASFQPGAPNEFQLVVKDEIASGQGRLTAEIHEVRGTGAGRTDAVIFSQALKPNQFEAQPLRLPTEAWTKLTPQSELFLVVKSEDLKTGAKTEIQDRVRLMGPVFATMLVTDKPTYRPGETLFFRSLTLDRVSFRPPEREQVLEYDLYDSTANHKIPIAKIATGGTDLVRSVAGRLEPVLVDGKPVRGVGSGSFALPVTLADGDYSLVLREQPHPTGYPPAVPVPVVRPIKVRSAPADDYRKRTGFLAASYSAGETVEGWAELSFRGKPVAGAEVEALATADNVMFNQIQQRPTTDGEGRVNYRFILPPELEKGDVRLQVTFKAKVGKDLIEETVAERVPVVGRNVVIEFFPEGGNLIAGVPCRVYFRATTPNSQPVDITGTLTDGRRELVKVETLVDPAQGASRGIGSFIYTPAIDTPVWVKLETPAGMFAPVIVPDQRSFPVAGAAVASGATASVARTGYLLPPPKSDGVAMTVLDPVTSAGQPIRVHLRSVGPTRKLVVGAYTRGRISDTKRVTAEPNQVAEVVLMASTDPRGGVVRITVFEEPAEENEAIAGGNIELRPDLKPVAERLVFRKPGEALKLNYFVNGALAPGDAAELDITATDEKGNPAAAILYAAAVNTGVAPGAKDRLLTTHFLIAGEINTPDAMEFADFLLTDHPKAPAVLDLVLATQGWRRFVEQTAPGYARKPTATSVECANFLVMNGQYSIMSDPAAVRVQKKLHETYWPQYESATKARDDARAALAAANADRTSEIRAEELTARVEQTRVETRALVERADTASASVARFNKAGWYGVAGFGLLGLLLGAACFARPSERLPLEIGAVGALGLVAFLVFALGTSEKSQAAADMNVELAQHPRASNVPALPPEPELTLANENSGVPALPAENPSVATTGRTGKDDVAAKGKKGVAAAPKVGGLPGRAGSDFRHTAPSTPIIPRVDPVRGGAMPLGAGTGGATGGGAGMAGGYHAGLWGKYGFWEHFSPPPKAAMPAPVTASGGPLPGVKVQSPVPAPGGITETGLGAMTDRTVGKPVIRLEEPSKWSIANGVRPSDQFFSVPSRPLTTPRPSSGPGPDGAFPDLRTHLELALSEAERAKDFAQLRARGLTEHMLETLSRKQSVSVAELKKALERVKGGDGWVVKQDAALMPALPLTPDEAFALLRIEQKLPKVPPLVVREYAAARPGSGDPLLLAADTVLWQPVIILPADGKAKIPFHVGFAPGGYEVVVAGHTLDGRIGAIRGIIPVAPAESTIPDALPGQPPPVPPPTP